MHLEVNSFLLSNSDKRNCTNDMNFQTPKIFLVHPIDFK